MRSFTALHWALAALAFSLVTIAINVLIMHGSVVAAAVCLFLAGITLAGWLVTEARAGRWAKDFGAPLLKSNAELTNAVQRLTTAIRELDVSVKKNHLGIGKGHDQMYDVLTMLNEISLKIDETAPLRPPRIRPVS